MQHIIVIGFKNAGKSTVGKALAKELKRPFIDLDDRIREAHARRTGEDISCRKIMQQHGEEHFRMLEGEVLARTLETAEPLVLAVGGGTPMMPGNRDMLARHVVIQVSAPKSIVFERIMVNGKPAFFPKNEPPFESFKRLWNEREPVFNGLASITVQNTGSVEEAVKKILNKLS